MKYPSLNELSTERTMIDVFGGYNHNLRINDAEFYDMKNLTSSYYPVLSPRGKRGNYLSVENMQGMIAKDSLCYVDGTDFVMNEYRIDMGLSTDAEYCPKRLVSMGAYVIILPDKKYINTLDLTDFGNIEASYESTDSVTFTMCGSDGEAYEAKYRGVTEPKGDDIANGDMWLDQSTTPHSLKVYSSSSGMWVTIGTTYIKIHATGIGKAFEQYDGVSISGLKGVELLDSATGDAIGGTVASQLAEIDGTFVVWDKGDNFIVIIGILDTEQILSNSIKVERKMPAMDFVIESENRLWGCHYGVANNGEVVNEIYSCKLGDFKNWNCFMGVSTDSYAASCGTDGQFTGAVTHLGYPLFFKENCLHKVYGNYPANYQIQTTACRGVQRGCSDSLAIVNEVLYYKSRNAVCAYDGSLPVEMSTSLGEISYSDAVACGHGNKYYISMKDAEGVYHLFVYDTTKGMWHKEDNTQVDFFCSCRNELYYVEHSSKVIKTMLGSGKLDSDPVEWMAETGVIGHTSPDKKYCSRLTVRMSLDIGTEVAFFAQYDSCGEWEKLFTMRGTSLRSFAVPVRPKRCDHFRIRIEGEGEAKIYSITKTLEQGSDIG